MDRGMAQEWLRMGRQATAAKDALMASLGGYLSGAAVLVACSLWLRSMPAGGDALGLLVLELIFSLVISFLGWMTFLFPVAWSYRPHGWMDDPVVMAPVGALAGVGLLVLLLSYWLSNGWQWNGGEIQWWTIYGASAATNAAAASAICVRLRRRSERRTRERLLQWMEAG